MLAETPETAKVVVAVGGILRIGGEIFEDTGGLKKEERTTESARLRSRSRSSSSVVSMTGARTLESRLETRAGETHIGGDIA